MEYEIKYKKIKCPACHKENSQWRAVPLDGDGSISFCEDDIDVSDIMVLSFEISCPNCGYTVSDLSYDDLLDIKDKGEVEK